MITRRNFCKTCGLMSMAGVMAPTFLAATVAAQPATLAAGKRALVVVQLTGGNDGLNTLIPYADSAYYTARPPLAFTTEKTVVLSFGGLDRFQFRGDTSVKGDRDAQLAAARKIYSVAAQNSTADYIRKTALDALTASDSLEKVAADYKPAVTYP